MSTITVSFNVGRRHEVYTPIMNLTREEGSPLGHDMSNKSRLARLFECARLHNNDVQILVDGKLLHYVEHAVIALQQESNIDMAWDAVQSAFKTPRAA